ncbi:C3a anaphylatoxin chemotactic receptor-like [Scyliorhinus torazame]|uniref:C3a anaphylatoxin chemotactic receptor-like n=1 Tax=Scyliorhinus torazame TaxID=75743 RepID=UPI003B5CDF4E
MSLALADCNQDNVQLDWLHDPPESKTGGKRTSKFSTVLCFSDRRLLSAQGCRRGNVLSILLHLAQSAAIFGSSLSKIPVVSSRRQIRLVKMSSTLMFDDDYFSLFTYTPYSSDRSEDDVLMVPLLFCSVICLLGISGNMLVMWIGGREVKKTVSMVWLLNLSLADFIFTATLPFSIAHLALKTHWPFGSFICKFLSFINHLNMFASVFILAVISLDRCISVTLPVWSQNHRTVQFACTVSLLVWILAVVFSIPFFLIRETAEDRLEGKTYCFYSEHTYSLSSLMVVRFVLAFLIPFITIAVCYSIIMVKVRRRWRKSSAKSCKITSMIIAAFFICWIPFHVLNIIHATSDEDFPVWLPIVTNLAYANSCVNPILYLFTGHGSALHIKERIQMALKAIHEEISSTGSRSDTRPGRSTA